MSEPENKNDSNITWPTTAAVAVVCTTLVLIVLICVNGCVALRGM